MASSVSGFFSKYFTNRYVCFKKITKFDVLTVSALGVLVSDLYTNQGLSEESSATASPLQLFSATSCFALAFLSGLNYLKNRYDWNRAESLFRDRILYPSQREIALKIDLPGIDEDPSFFGTHQLSNWKTIDQAHPILIKKADSIESAAQFLEQLHSDGKIVKILLLNGHGNPERIDEVTWSDIQANDCGKEVSDSAESQSIQSFLSNLRKIFKGQVVLDACSCGGGMPERNLVSWMTYFLSAAEGVGAKEYVSSRSLNVSLVRDSVNNEKSVKFTFKGFASFRQEIFFTFMVYLAIVCLCPLMDQSMLGLNQLASPFAAWFLLCLNIPFILTGIQDVTFTTGISKMNRMSV